MRILWLKTELLHPVDKGGKIRTYAMLRELRKQHHVTYLTLDDGTAAADARDKAMEYCQEVITVPFTQPRRGTLAFYADLLRNVFSPLPYAVSKYRSPTFRHAIAGTVARGRFDVVVCDFLTPSVNVPAGLGVATVLFEHNVEAAIWERHAAVATHPIKKAYMREQWRRMLRWETRECQRFDHVVAVSDADRDTFRDRMGVSEVSSVPTGVDIDYFSPTGVARNPHEIVFTGSMDWLPNEDGLEWFCDEILPLVRAKVPVATVSVVGRNPSPRVKSLAARHTGVTVTGTVPDVRPYLERAGALVVPLRIGGGTRLKIYEGMSMGRPTVSTTIGAEGLPVHHGAEILIADSATDFAAAVAGVLADPSSADALGQRAAARVRRDFSWDGVARQFAQTCASVVERLSSRRN
ncbi:MAG: glycosyltransferase [Gemmatimonadetes bacterium]|nr:glycosyltransferase [Gemmatimonadota bacterium]